MKRIIFILTLLFSSQLLSAAIKEVPLTFISDGLTFSGTLTLPEGNGPFPVTVFIHGSGPQDRDQTADLNNPNAQCLYSCIYGETVKNFRDIAHAFAEQGIASFRYDKRTYTHAGSIDVKTISPYDMITDLHNAIDMVKARPEIDPNRIYLLGHSKGVNNIAIAAGARTDIKALIAVAGAARPIDSILVQQIRYIYKECLDSAQGEAAAKQIEDVFAQMRAGTWPSSQPFMGVYPKFWIEWMGITDSAVIHYNRIDHPVLFIQGDADFNIPVENILRFQKYVTRSNARFVIMDSLNHMLTHPCDPMVPKVFTDTIISFLKDVEQAASIGEKTEKDEKPFRILYHDLGVQLLFNETVISTGTWDLLDLYGKRIRAISVTKESAFITNTGLAPGIYFIRVDNSIVEKILIR